MTCFKEDTKNLTNNIYLNSIKLYVIALQKIKIFKLLDYDYFNDYFNDFIIKHLIKNKTNRRIKNVNVSPLQEYVNYGYVIATTIIENILILF